MRLSLIRVNHKFPATQENLEKARELGLSLTTFTTLVLWLGLAPTKGRQRYAELGSSSSRCGRRRRIRPFHGVR